ncbi:MAG: TraR/DksA family transcriptional regulator, partial [bacterium]
MDHRLEELRDKLQYERDLLLQEIGKEHSVSEVSSHGDLVDQSVDYTQREMLLGLAEHDRERVLAIDEALRQIESGTYGTCNRCAKPIPEARLIA